MSFGDLFGQALQAASDAGQRAMASVKQGYAVAKEAVKTAVRQTTQSAVNALGRGTTDAIDSVEAAADLIDAAKQKASALFDKASHIFSPDKPVEVPVQPCPKAPRDDGKLFGIKNGKCGPLDADPATSTSQKLAGSAVTPSADPATASCCDQRFPPGVKRPTIFYINGIQTTPQSHCTTLHAIADSQCASVIGILNDTAGLTKMGMAGDLRQAAKDRELIKQAAAGKPIPTMDGRNPAVDSLSNLLYNDLLADNHPILYAHSQGGADASLALHDVRNRLEVADIRAFDNLTVKSFGSAAPSWPDGPAYTHYIHNNDLMPVYTGLGDSPGELAGAGAKVIHFSGSQATGFTEGMADRPWVATGSLNGKGFYAHDVNETYLGMLRQTEGGCPGAAG